MTYDKTTLLGELKRLIVEVCEKDVDPDALSDDEALFGPEARLALDSLDALQLSMALQKQYGIRITDSKETRKAFTSVGYLADFLLAAAK